MKIKIEYNKLPHCLYSKCQEKGLDIFKIIVQALMRTPNLNRVEVSREEKGQHRKEQRLISDFGKQSKTGKLHDG